MVLQTPNYNEVEELFIVHCSLLIIHYLYQTAIKAI